MAIIGNLPNTLNNGSTADATQVMADLNYIVTQVNSNGQPLLPATPTFSGLVITGLSTTFGSGQNNEIDLIQTNANTTGQYFLNPVGLEGFYDVGRALVRWSSDTSGNFNVAGSFTASGNVTAYSDERLKKDWADLPVDFIARLAAVKHGTFTRVDSGARQVGVGAQSLRMVLPEAVADGKHLSVAYGNAALVAAIKLAARVLELEDRIAALEQAK